MTVINDIPGEDNCDPSTSTLISKRIGGGSLVSYKPLITRNSRKVLVISGKLVKVFNTSTGELLQELDGHKNQVVGLTRHHQLQDHFLSCDDCGEVILWSLDQKSSKQVIPLQLPGSSKGKSNVVTLFTSCSETGRIFVVIKDKVEDQTGSLYSYSNVSINARPSFVTNAVIIGPNKVVIGASAEYVAAIKKTTLFIKKLVSTSSKIVKHKSGNREMVCVSSHPSQQVLATGDNTGRIVLWYNIFCSSPTKVVLHWHTLPLADIAFSCTGNELISGGAESVLVRWQLSEDRHSFLPRLGAPICLISTDHKNSIIITAHIDNALNVVNFPEWRRDGVIQGLAANVSLSKPFPTGMTLHPSTNSIIMNAHSGHLQFFDVQRSKQLYQLDITARNYISSERFEEIFNIDVISLAISSDGNWLATFEGAYPSTNSLHDFRLKFWNYKKEDQSWSLNTSVEMPHEAYIEGIDFQVVSQPSHTPLCLTYATDGKFKIWKIEDDSDIYRENVCWNCAGVGVYRDLPVTAASFSPDGSLLAAAFNSVITLWKPESCSLRGTLSQPYVVEPYLDVLFGRGEGNIHLLVGRSSGWLVCWDLLYCSLKWRVSVATTCITVHPRSGVMAGFTTDNSAFLFEPRKCQPLSWQNNVSSSTIIAAVFVPNNTGSVDHNLPWDPMSSLYFLEDNFTINKLQSYQESDGKSGDDGSENDEGKVREFVNNIEEEDSNKTNFSALLARSKNVQQNTQNHSQLTTFTGKDSSQKFLKQVLSEVSIHHMESFEALTSSFCKMVIPGDDINESRIKSSESNQAKFKEQEEQAKKQKRKQMNKKKKKELENVENIDFDEIVRTLYS